MIFTCNQFASESFYHMAEKEYETICIQHWDCVPEKNQSAIFILASRCQYPKVKKCPAARYSQKERGWNRDYMYFGYLTLKADFVKFFCASSLSGRKPSSEGKGGREIKQPFHLEGRQLLVSCPTDPSNSIFIPHPQNSKALWCLTSAFKPLCSLVSLAESTQTPEKWLRVGYLAVLISARDPNQSR